MTPESRNSCIDYERDCIGKSAIDWTMRTTAILPRFSIAIVLLRGTVILLLHMLVYLT